MLFSVLAREGKGWMSVTCFGLSGLLKFLLSNLKPYLISFLRWLWVSLLFKSCKFVCLFDEETTDPSREPPGPFNIQSCLLRKIQSNKKNLINFVNVEMLLYFLHVGKCPPWPSFKLCAMEQTKCLITLWTCYHPTSFMSMTIMCIENKQLNHELVRMDQMHME